MTCDGQPITICKKAPFSSLVQGYEMQGVLGATVKGAEGRPDGEVSTPIGTADQLKRCRRHLPKSMDRSLDTHFALSISRAVSPLAFL